MYVGNESIIDNFNFSEIFKKLEDELTQSIKEENLLNQKILSTLSKVTINE